MLATPIRSVALVTDAASPVGRAVALALAQQGWDLALHYQDDAVPAALAALLTECQALGVQAITVRCILSQDLEIHALLPRVAAELGSVRCIVNNASHVEQDSPASFSAAVLERHMQNNLAAPLLLAQALYMTIGATTVTPHSGGAQAVVINLLDQKLFNPQPDFLSYTLSKAALHSATALLAQAYAPLLRVVAIAPSLAATASASKPPATLEDIAATVCFVAASSAITGSTLLVDGGQHLYPYPRDHAAAHSQQSHPH